MPCNDVSENITIVLDAEDKLKSYRLTKSTCGNAVGIESYLLGDLGEKTVDGILAFDLINYDKPHNPENHAAEFVARKHLYALKSTLQVYTGKSPGGVSEPCTIVDVGSDGLHTVIHAQVDIDLVTGMIEACSHCGTG